jgi:hypothetical protein
MIGINGVPSLDQDRDYKSDTIKLTIPLLGNKVYQATTTTKHAPKYYQKLSSQKKTKT